MSALEAFHFIRPGVLLLAVPAALVIWAILRRQDPLRRLARGDASIGEVRAELSSRW